MTLANPAEPKRPRRLRRWLAGVAILALACAAGGYVAAGMTPGWWNVAPVHSQAELEVGRALEQGIVSQATQVRGPGTQKWSVRVRAADINAWFAARLPQWLEHDRSLPWPKDVGIPQVRFTSTGIEAAAAHGARIVTSRWRLEPGTNGAAATLVPDGARLGLLPVPAANSVGGWFVPELRSAARLEAKLGDGRLVRVISAEFAEGEAIIDCETTGN